MKKGKNDNTQFITEDFGCMLRYKVSDRSGYVYKNKQNYEYMKKALEKVGISLEVDGSELKLAIDNDLYVQKNNRHAGKKRKVFFKNEKNKNSLTYRYSDILHDMQTMTDKQICENLGIAPATFARHKKIMLASEYYRLVDKNRLDDLEYLETVRFNFSF